MFLLDKAEQKGSGGDSKQCVVTGRQRRLDFDSQDPLLHKLQRSGGRGDGFIGGSVLLREDIRQIQRKVRNMFFVGADK